MKNKIKNTRNANYWFGGVIALILPTSGLWATENRENSLYYDEDGDLNIAVIEQNHKMALQHQKTAEQLKALGMVHSPFEPIISLQTPSWLKKEDEEKYASLFMRIGRVYHEEEKKVLQALELLQDLHGLENLALKRLSPALSEKLVHIKGLKKLILAEELTQEGVQGVEKLKELEEIEMLRWGSKMTDQQRQNLWQSLAELKGLKKLSIRADSKEVLSGQSLIGLDKCQHLESITFIGVSLSDAAIASLVRLKRLKKLVLIEGIVSETGFEKLAALESLEEFHTQYTFINEEGWKHIGRWKGLRTLHLGGRDPNDALLEVTVESLEALKGLDKLEELYINGSPLREETLKHLEKLLKGGAWPALKRLILYMPESEEGLRVLVYHNHYKGQFVQALKEMGREELIDF